MVRLASAQAKALRRRLFANLLIALLLFTACYAMLLAVAQILLVPAIADMVADLTTSWTYADASDLGTAYTALVEQGYQNLDVWQTTDGRYGIRDLTIYNAVASLKIPLAAALYLAGCLAIVLAMLNRSIKSFDQLSHAVTNLLANHESAVNLPDELAIVRAELSEVRARSLADDRTAKAAENRKNELVAYLAHDIKTPLTSVIGYLSLLKESPDLPKEARERFATTAYDKALRLDDLVDEFFEITRYNLKSIPIEREYVDIELLCRQIADEFFPEADERNVAITVTASADTTVFVDPDKMARALSNIARNAIAYAEEGSTVSISAVKTGQALVVAVENQGREIAPEHLESIFDKFFREDGARSTNRGGAGLGLAIAKEIIAAHGGAITASSENGRTTFSISLPGDLRSNPESPYASSEKSGVDR